MDRLLSVVKEHPDITLFEPSNPTPTCADTARECGVSHEQIVKTIILCAKRGNTRQYVAAILCGNDQIDQNILKRVLNVKKVTFVSSEETEAISGFPAGGVPPIALNNELSIVVESGILRRDRVIAGGGTKTKLIDISPQRILQLNNVLETHTFAKLDSSS